ncbi:adenine nucleotide translocase lysine N-methyltransferase isoform X2 [Clupea harengus]|uniref:Adenine nucleotide translocase lysine N-methyltransferase isoform X2 n=1 Tax=Clupea harengus TaxID=7950 RepID=A0A6P8FTM7_CLUHA|nr:adenine nucleotide translocase lysine N-methyltransferase isoform X2 [Clupea harengus]
MDDIDVILQDKRLRLLQQPLSPIFTASTGALLLGVYRLWTVFALPGFRKVPVNLKVPFLPSGKTQTQNVMKLLRGRRGCLVDLGSGDGRLVFAASHVGLRCTGYEINFILTTSAQVRAWWRGVPPSSASFVSRDFWKSGRLSLSCLPFFTDRSVRLQQCDSVLGPWCDGRAWGEAAEGAA